MRTQLTDYIDYGVISDGIRDEPLRFSRHRAYRQRLRQRLGRSRALHRLPFAPEFLPPRRPINAVSRSWAAVVDRHHVHRHVRRVNTTAVPYPLAPAAGLFPDREQYTPVRGAGVHRVRTPSARLRRLEWFTTPGSTRSETDSAYDKRTVPSRRGDQAASSPEQHCTSKRRT